MAATTKATMPGLCDDSSDKPSLGKYELFNGKDDALQAIFCKLTKFKTYQYAFTHARHYMELFAMLVLEGLEEFREYYFLAKCALYWSRLRNSRLIRKINLRIAAYNAANPDKKPVRAHRVDAETAEIESKRPAEEVFAQSLGFDFTSYLDETNDDADVQDCTDGNARGLSFNFDGQLDRLETATDQLRLVKDLNGVWWFIMIIRVFGPHRATVATIGGFGEPGESFKQTGDREGDEELETDAFDAREGITITKTEGVFDAAFHKLSDARARLAIHGILVSVSWKIYVFTKSA